MIRDLKLAGDLPVKVDAAVCVIGAGTAGLFLAKLLRQRGVEVVQLEVGGAAPQSPVEIGERCELRGNAYRGADSGRSFGLGGTSAIWGGQMISLAASDVQARPGVAMDAWPIGHSDIERYVRQVREQFALEPSREAGAQQGAAERLKGKFPYLRDFDPHFGLRLSEWLPFGRRNFANSFREDLNGDPGWTVWLNAAVTRLHRSSREGAGTIDEVTARSTNGRTLQVRAGCYVICAGALESTRLLLSFDDDSEGILTREGAPLGRYFSDHLSTTCGVVRCRNWPRYNLAVAPLFHKGILHSPRLELTGPAQDELALTNAFAHLTFVTAGDSGFNVVRSMLMRRQRQGGELALTAGMIGRAIRDVSFLAYWRAMHGRLWIPRHSELFLQVDVEQLPNPESRLYLSSQRDALGRRTLVVEWRIHPSDMRTIQKVTDMVVRGWQRSPLRQLADLEPIPLDVSEGFASPYDVYHPAGSLRMGSTPATSVVDGHLRLWCAPNCYVSTTAVFPSTGGANPGLTHLALTARIADEIARSQAG